MMSMYRNREGSNGLPLRNDETVYVGVDIGKRGHVAGFVSHRLLEQYKELIRCPFLKFEQSREGFEALLAHMEMYVPLARCCVLMERTGHYHKLLEQFLHERTIPVYTIQVQERQRDRDKTDKVDALHLALLLYQQVEHGMHAAHKRQKVQQMAPVSDTILFLRALVRHRYELVQECTQRKNRLIAICDELFPEFTRIFKDPNLPTALGVRQRFPTPVAIIAASFEELRALRLGKHPSNVKLIQLQALAAETIGIKNAARQHGLVLEQAQLINELLMMQKHIEDLEREIRAIAEPMREVRTLTSIPVIGLVQAATLIAIIGSIDNFSSAAELRAYLGWAPIEEQTGTTRDSARLTPRGSRMGRQILYLIVANTIRLPNEWAKLYQRLVPLKCVWDERTKKYKGKVKVMGRVAGQMVNVIFALLKKDSDTLRALRPGDPIPGPVLYDPAIHCTGRRSTR